MAHMSIPEARRLVGLNQNQLAKKAGIARGDLHALENGRVQRPSWEVVGRIVAALRESGLPGLTPEQLFPIERSQTSEVA